MSSLGHHLASIAYRAAYGLSLPVVLPLLSAHPNLRGGFGQRLGLAPRTHSGALWAHGSSAGDVLALLPLLDCLRQMPAKGLDLVLSCFTASGSDMARARGWHPFRAPLDLGWTVMRALERVKPRLLMLECLELWPTLVGQCQQRGVPVMVVNGRLSARSAGRYRRAAVLFRPLFSRLTKVIALSAEDAERFLSVGVCERRVEVCTSSKHGVLAGPAERYGGDRPPKLVFGSLHPSELALLLPLLAEFVTALPDEARFVFAPRYVSQSEMFARQLGRHGVRAALSSRDPGAKVRVLDSMGQLVDEYRRASVAFIGASLVPRGGHNVLEAAAHAVPVVTGPFTDNCRAELQMLCDRRAACRAQSVERVLRQMLEWARYRPEVGERAASVTDAFRSSATTIAARILATVESSVLPGSADRSLAGRC